MRILTISSFLIALVSLIASGYLAFKPTPKVGFVYNQRIFDEYLGTEELKSELEKYRQYYQLVLDSLEVQIDGGNEDLKYVYQQKLEGFSSQYEGISEKYSAEIWMRINEVMHNFGEENNFEMIFGTAGGGNLMYAKHQHDLTDEFLKFLNNKYQGQ
jgi:Skp family chaperone for outer membrane proteins